MYEWRLKTLESIAPFVALVESSAFIAYLLTTAVPRHPNLQRLLLTLRKLRSINMVLLFLVQQLLRNRRSICPYEWHDRIKKHMIDIERLRSENITSLSSTNSRPKSTRLAYKCRTNGIFEPRSTEYSAAAKEKRCVCAEIYSRQEKEPELLRSEPQLWPAYSINRG